MTTDEAIRRLKEARGTIQPFRYINEAIDYAIKTLEQETGWIPVSERLPDKNGEYLVTVKKGYITFGIWVGEAENWAQAVAWMPLPEPYKAESEVRDADSN